MLSIVCKVHVVKQLKYYISKKVFKLINNVFFKILGIAICIALLTSYGGNIGNPIWLEEYESKYLNILDKKADYINEIFISLLNMWKNVLDEGLINE